MRAELKSIRVYITTIIIVILTISIAISFFIARTEVFESAEKDLQGRIRDKLNFIQGATEQFLELGITERIRQIVSSISSEPDLIFISIVNKNGVVISSSYVSDVGKSWNELNKRLDKQEIRKVTEEKSTSILLNKEDGIVDGYISICGKANESFLRQKNCGFAVYRANLAYHYNKAESGLVHETKLFSSGTIIAVVVILLLMEFIINRPAIRIINTLRLFNSGKHTARIKITGDNEISRISESINDVLEEVVSNEKAIRDREERLRAVIETTIDAIITINRNGIIESINPAVEQHLGYNEKDLLGENIKKIMPAPYHDNHDQYLENYHQTGRANVIGNQREVMALTKSGIEIPVELSVTETNINGEVIYTGVLRDISERVQLREAMKKINQELFSSNLELKSKNRIDSLTGLANRGYFDGTLSSEIRRAIRQSQPLSLMMIDIDHFKLYNDHYGHQQGDECLKQVADTMKSCFMRSGELAARYGGEEFAVILPVTDCDQAIKSAEKLNKAIYDLNLEHAGSKTCVRVTVSVGVTTLLVRSSDMVTEREIIESADRALYQAKEQGRNRACDTTITN